MITTIQIHKDIKKGLDLIKNERESYESVISRLLDLENKQKILNEKLMIKGYKKMAKESLRITRDWEATDKELDWEW
ncbi:hypothetical protein HYT56_03190 [Candidatus Woesearchaeota archaeon]|nr:hypothetical protein [Candidatus Woesearchaeota archaeon]